MKLIAFCEAPSDFRMASGLVDRVLREVGPAWVVDNLDAPGVVLRWHADGLGNDFINVHYLNQYTDQLRKRGVACAKSADISTGVPETLAAPWRARRS